MNRYLQPYIVEDLPQKIVLITGPRQCGKTTLSKHLDLSYDYLNYDSARDRLALKEQSWDRMKQLVIFDELHKMRGWKQWLKGIYDTENVKPSILVTGSAKLNAYRKVGDSLEGRYFQYHLHPLDLKEALIYWQKDAYEILERLLICGSFPEPFLKGEESYYRRWRKTHLDIILRQDLLDIYAARDIQAIETLVLLLKHRVSSTISYANLARELERDSHTIKRWLIWLENLYIIFRVTPYHKKITRSLQKEPKYYFYDTALIEDAGAKMENLVACALLKEIQFLEDTLGLQTSLHFLRTKDGQEIDFLIAIDQKPTHAIEVKIKDDTPTTAFKYFQRFLSDLKWLQLVYKLPREKTYPNGVEVRDLVTWLGQINLQKRG